MHRITVNATQLGNPVTVVRAVVRFVYRAAFAGALGVAGIAALLARGGYSATDGVATIVLLAPPAILLLFAMGIRELLSVPEQLRRMPGEGQARVSELTQLAGQTGTKRVRGMPLLLWRLRGTAGSLRSIAGIALPLKVLTPGFLGLALLAALGCVVLVGAGVIALVVLATG